MLRSSGFYGGPERQIHQHALASRDSGISVIIGSFVNAGTGKAPDLLRIASEDELETRLFDARHSYDPAVVMKLRRYLIESEIDILATHDYRASLIGFFAVMGTNCRWLAWSRGWTIEGPKVALFQFVEKIIVRFADRVLVVADSQGEKLRRWFVPKDKIIVIHNAVDPVRLAKFEAIDLRFKFSLPAHSIVITSAGRFSAEKGQRILLQAAAAVISEVPEAYFLLFGDGPEREEVREIAKSLGVGDHVICPGFEANIIGHIRGADILVNPSLTEGLPNVVLEAMAVRIPVIATSVGGVPELITDGSDGRLVPANDPTALGRAIVDLATDVRHRDLLREAGLLTVVEHFSVVGQNHKLQEVYKELLGD